MPRFRSHKCCADGRRGGYSGKPQLTGPAKGSALGGGGLQKPSAEKNERRDSPFCRLNKVLIIHLWRSPVEEFLLASEGPRRILPAVSRHPDAREATPKNITEATC